VIGFAFFFTGFTISGFIQGSSWVNLGLPIWTVLPALRAAMTLRIMGGSLLVISFCMFAWNIVATVIVRRPFEQPEMPTREPVFRSNTAAAVAPTVAAEVTKP
jgi:cbb3-type cytochrome oxidase subunit 1